MRRRCWGDSGGSDGSRDGRSGNGGSRYLILFTVLVDVPLRSILTNRATVRLLLSSHFGDGLAAILVDRSPTTREHMLGSALEA